MRFLAFVLLLVGILNSAAWAAKCDVSHSAKFNSDLAKVVQTCKNNRNHLLKMNGVEILAQQDNNRFKVRIKKNTFVIQEDRMESDKKVVVTWKLVESHGAMKEYNSTISYEANGTGTLVQGNITAELGGTEVGSRVMQRDVTDGIKRMQKETARLLGEKVDRVLLRKQLR